MSWIRWRTVVRPSAREEADAEIAFHIEERTRDLIEQGLEPERARAMAEERFGSLMDIERTLIDSTQRRREREERAEGLMNMKQDLAYAIRSLRNSRAFSAAAVATLALGLGATLAVFTVVNGVLLRPMPYKEPSRIAMIWMTAPGMEGTASELPFSSGFFNLVAEQQTSFAAIAAFRGWSYSLVTAGAQEPERLNGARVGPGLFDVLGVRPLAGQTFTEAHAVPGAPKVAVISHELWQRRFGADRGIIGRQVELSGEPFTITGVMPPGFAFPRGAELPPAFQFAQRTDIWTPLVFDSSDVANFGTMNLSAVGRLGAGVHAEQAQAEATGIVKRMLAEIAPNLKLETKLISISDQAAQKVRRGLLILLGAVVIVLLIASANVASLLVARVQARHRELAVRAALGAGRSRIARQLVTENVVLWGTGGVLGLALSYWATKVMLALVPGSMPRADDIGLDWRVVTATVLAVLVAGALFGVIAAASVSWTRLSETLHAGDTRSAGGRRQRSGRRLIVTAEVALSLMLLIGASLLTRSFMKLQRVEPGFEARNLLIAGVSLPIAGRFDPADGPAWARSLDGMTARLNASAGVVAAGAVSSLPLTGAIEAGGVHVVGEPVPEPGRIPPAQYNIVSGRYFDAAGIRVLAGRAFDSRDDGPDMRTIIVNRTFAMRRFGSDVAAIGREARATFEFSSNPRPRVIVGVVADVRQQTLDEDPVPQVYVPESQMAYPGLTLVVRTEGDPLQAVQMVKTVVRAVDPAAMVTDIRSMQDVLSQSLARQRFSMTLIGSFAGLALILAAVGLYAVLALGVAQRQREIGVRLALGARPGDVVRLVVGEGALLTAIGVVAGLAGAFALTRVLASLLYGISATDVLTFIGAAACVAAVALAATFVPARRAARVDPKTALAAE